MGTVVGAFCWSFIFLINLSSNFLWHELPHIIKVSSFTITIILCTLGGLIIGLCQKFLGPYPKEMEEILHEYKITKTIDYKPLPKYIACAFLPLIFGGSIGPEAGLFGMTAMFSTFLSKKIKNSNPELKEEFIETSTSAVLTAIFQVPLFTSFSYDKNSIYKVQLISKKLLNYFTYSCTALSTYFIMKILNNLIHKESFNFKLAQNHISNKDLLFFIPILILSIIIGLSFNYIGHLIECICKKTKLSSNPFIAAIIGGFILALLGAYFPLTLFSGEHALRETINNSGELGNAYLLLIAFLKILATKISINFRWVGGQIFPTIFASFCIAFALSGILNIDPTYLVAITSTGVITVVIRKPIIAVVLICFFLPVTYWIFVIISSFSINFIINKFIYKTSLN
ncbi:chloride channel protein [Clostridium sp. CF012]|uniref:chloride channel protein n=1 Tax=Clostridium sp. CF012 TaxID=2843319 RepID=UPI001C0D2582|nr:chloride channel protein [Clostridium sp. CF012]MBU3145828.1 chloride channel protein [Clostridium sp. CF012]